uniref:Uncharacterized protein n=1 Tax=Populus trichocarpa TaxID=3694 RepID=A0A2K1XXL7_POPTR
MTGLHHKSTFLILVLLPNDGGLRLEPHLRILCHRDEKFTIKVFSNNWFVRQSPNSEEHWHLAKLPALILYLVN